jgi:hypothetical protein
MMSEWAMECATACVRIGEHFKVMDGVKARVHIDEQLHR